MMYPNWRGFCGILTLAASLAVLGCGTSNSNVRIVNASPGFAPFSIQVGQTVIGSIPYGTEGVQPKGDRYSSIDTSGNYRIIGAATAQQVSAFAAIGSTPFTTTKADFLKNDDYTVVSLGTSPGMQLVVLADNNSAPASGQAKLRFLNASTTSGPIDVYITAVGAPPSGTPTIGNLPYNQNPSYIPPPLGTLELQITQHGSTQVLASAPFSPASGGIYSVFFLDPAAGSSYKVLVVTDPVSTTATTSSGS